jgi:hypothetical protein
MTCSSPKLWTRVIRIHTLETRNKSLIAGGWIFIDVKDTREFVLAITRHATKLEFFHVLKSLVVRKTQVGV